MCSLNEDEFFIGVIRHTLLSVEVSVMEIFDISFYNIKYPPVCLNFRVIDGLIFQFC